MNMIKQCIEITEKIYPEVLKIRRHLHSHPELSGQEIETSKFISQILNSLSIENEHTSNSGITATLYGSHPQNKNLTIAIRADMDALPIEEKTGLPFASAFPGKMHACGHDMHTAILLGTAMLLSKIKHKLKGNIRFIFEPAEETVGGAKVMIEEGALKSPDVSAVIGLHVQPELPCGSVGFVKETMCAASCEFTLIVKGTGCHGAHPDQGSDPILAAASVICALQSIISRNTPPTDPSVITIGSIQGGKKGNIIPDKVICTGIIRSLTEDGRIFIKERLRSLSHLIACGMGCECDIEFKDSYPPLINDDVLLQTMAALSNQVFGKDKVHISDIPSMGADDFAYFSREVPSLYFDIGVAHENTSLNFPIHSEKFNPKEEAIKTGILAEALGVLKMLE